MENYACLVLVYGLSIPMAMPSWHGWFISCSYFLYILQMYCNMTVDDSHQSWQPSTVQIAVCARAKASGVNTPKRCAMTRSLSVYSLELRT